MARFIHLHVHTEWSLLDSVLRISDIVRKALEYRMPAVAITDHGHLFGLVYFYKKMREAGLKPIIGCEFSVLPEEKKGAGNGPEAEYHLVLLAQNGIGYRNLCKLATRGHPGNFHRKSFITHRLLKDHSEGLIALSACLKGEIPAAILSGNPDRARELILVYKQIFSDRFYLEIQENGLKGQRRTNEVLLQMAEDFGVPVVATNNCHYLSPEDAFSRKILLSLEPENAPNSPDQETGKFDFASPEEMARRLEDYPPEVLSNTLEVAERVNLELPLKGAQFAFHLWSKRDYTKVFEERVREGLKRRLKELSLTLGLSAPEKDYWERLEYEIEVLKKKGLAAYFLFISEALSWARRRGILVGPGRGAVGGSLVAYALGITGLDPLRFGLLFERFVNPKKRRFPRDPCNSGA